MLSWITVNMHFIPSNSVSVSSFVTTKKKRDGQRKGPKQDCAGQRKGPKQDRAGQRKGPKQDCAGQFTVSRANVGK